MDSPAGFLESCRGVSRPTTEAAYLVNQRNAANAAVIAVEMRRPSAAAFNQSQTDKPGLRGGITPLSNNNIVETGESQYWATGGRVREYRLLNRVPITLPRIDLVELDDQKQSFYRGPPLREILLGLGKPLDIVRGVLERYEWLALWRNDWLVEGAGPGHQKLRTNPGVSLWFAG